MKKVFLYLYPIEEFTKTFLVNDDSNKKWYLPDSLHVLNDSINRRYRQKGYEIVFALFPDKKIFGIDMYKGDRVIYTDIPFKSFNLYDEEGNKKKMFNPRYPSELYLLAQLGDIDELVVSGYHHNNTVKRVAEVALDSGISTLIDLDLTDLFFNLYDKTDYFNVENYDLNKFMEYIINKDGEKYQEFNRKQFISNYSSPAYGFSDFIKERKL